MNSFLVAIRFLYIFIPWHKLRREWGDWEWKMRACVCMYFCYIIRSFDGEIVATVKEKKSIFRLQLIKNIAATVDIIKLCTRIIWAHHHIFIYLSILCDAMLESFLLAFFLLQFSCINKRLICSFFRSLNISSGWNNLWHNELMKYYIICMYLFVLYTIVFTFYADSVTHRVRVYGIYFYQLIFFPFFFRCYCWFIHNYTYKSNYWWAQWKNIYEIWNKYWVDGNMTGCYCNHRT